MLAVRAVDQPGDPLLAHEGGVADRPAWAVLGSLAGCSRETDPTSRPDRLGGRCRFRRAHLVLNDPGQPIDQRAAQGLGDRPSRPEGEFDQPDIPGRDLDVLAPRNPPPFPWQ